MANEQDNGVHAAERMKDPDLWIIFKIPGGILKFDLGTEVRPEVSTTTL